MNYNEALSEVTRKYWENNGKIAKLLFEMKDLFSLHTRDNDLSCANDERYSFYVQFYN